MQIQTTPPVPAAPAIYGVANPTAEWQGAVAARRELNDQRNTLEGTRDALLILRASSAAEIVERLASDPWTTNGLLITKQISPWQLRLGSLG